MVVLIALGCDQDERELQRELLQRVEAIDVSQAPETRAEQVAALEELPVQRPKLAELQQDCVRAHRLLLRAERHQARARDALERQAEAMRAGTLEDASAGRLAADLQRSDEALKHATELFRICQQGTRDLALRLR